MSEILYVEDEMRDLVANVAVKFGLPVHYIFGHPAEITKRMQELTKGVTTQGNKFPLVWLMTDFTTKRGIDGGDYDQVSLTLLICNITQLNYTSEERLENNFKTVLMPIWELLVEEIRHSKVFSTFQDLTYDETRRYFYGSVKNNANVLNDLIDALEIANFQIYIKTMSCDPPVVVNHLF